MPPAATSPRLDSALLRPGMRVAVACSGGADSVALLRAVLEQRATLGLVPSVAHMNHGIRGAEAEEDQAFVANLATRFGLPFHLSQVDTPRTAADKREGLEATARGLRYEWFSQLLASNEADAVLTAHTLDDQAETVLHRIVRGAWTEGLAGIHPVLQPSQRQSGLILRPFLGATRAEIESWLGSIEQPWREDSSNLDTAFTRNRLRHELLPALTTYNPRVRRQLAQLASLARDDEAYWQLELSRVLPSLLLPGKAVRGGGRATGAISGDASLSIEIERLRPLHPALRRRVLRGACKQLGAAIDFEDTERLLALCGLSAPPSPKTNLSKVELSDGLRAERTPRELKLFMGQRAERHEPSGAVEPGEYLLPIPGAVTAPAFGLRLQADLGKPVLESLPPATLRPSRAGDRVRLRHSRSRLKIKEAFLRARLPMPTVIPVLEWRGEIVWMADLALEPDTLRAAGLSIKASPLDVPESNPAERVT